jgi:hypothetical protein
VSVSVRHPGGHSEFMRGLLYGMMVVTMEDHVVEKVRKWKTS